MHSDQRLLLAFSIITPFALCKISIFWLVSVAEQTGLCVTLSETTKTVLRKTGFLALRPIIDWQFVDASVFSSPEWNGHW